MVDAFLVDGRYWGRQVPFLDMYADPTEMPDSSTGDPKTADAYWLAMSARFTGQGHWLDEDGAVGSSEGVVVQGDLKVAIKHGRCYLLVSGDAIFDPAIWISCPSGRLVATALNPSSVTILGNGWQIEAGEVGRLYRSSETFQENRAPQLVEALRRPAPPLPALVPPERARPRFGNWQRGLDQVWTARRSDGARFASFANPAESRRARIHQLEGVEGLPANVIAKLSRRIVGATDLVQAPGPAPGGRCWAPLTKPMPGLVDASSSTHARPATSAVAYLWPTITEGGAPFLESDEKIIDRWPAPDVRWGFGSSDAVMTLTDRRIVCVSARPLMDMTVFSESRSDTLLGRIPRPMHCAADFDVITDVAFSRLFDHVQWWAWHVRWEWVGGVVLLTQQMERMQRATLFAKPTPVHSGWSEFHLGVRLADGELERILVTNEYGAPGVIGPTRRCEQVMSVIGGWAKDRGILRESPPARHDFNSRSGETGSVLTREWVVQGSAGYTLPARYDGPFF